MGSHHSLWSKVRLVCVEGPSNRSVCLVSLLTKLHNSCCGYGPTKRLVNTVFLFVVVSFVLAVGSTLSVQ